MATHTYNTKTKNWRDQFKQELQQAKIDAKKNRKKIKITTKKSGSIVTLIITKLN